MALRPFYSRICSESLRPFFPSRILMAKFGEPMKEKIDKHFNLLAIVFGILLLVELWCQIPKIKEISNNRLGAYEICTEKTFPAK